MIMPPPPPPPGPPRPPPAPGFQSKAAGPSDRSALLQSIQKGKALKKTVTNDRSGPFVGGKSNNSPTSNEVDNENSRAKISTSAASSSSASRLPGIGGLFADGFPNKSMLRPTSGGNSRQDVSNGSNSGPTSWSADSNGKNNINASNRGPRSGNFGSHLQSSTSTSSIANSYSSSSLSYSRNITMSAERYNFFMMNSTPSLTPSASPSSSTSSIPKSQATPQKPSAAPPPPPSNTKPRHPSARPPAPPPGGGKPAMRTRSFNQGRGEAIDDDFEEGTPAPPVRTVSQQQQSHYSSQTMPSRRSGPQSRPALPGATRTPPMKPPTAPPPPPPSSHPPPPPHRTQPAPPPSTMQMQQVKASQLMSSSPNQSLSSISAPPTPPTRRHSLRANNGANNSQGETFESRFSHMFKSPQYLPPPEPFVQCAKTYPSRNQQQFGGRQGSMMKRAPAPPPPPQKGAPPPPAPAWTPKPIRG